MVRVSIVLCFLWHYVMNSTPIALSDMHPLAVEDLLHVRKASRSKADYYHQHLFLRILCHTLASEDDMSSGDVATDSVTRLPRSESPLPFDEDDLSDDDEDSTGKVDEEKTLYGSQPTSRFTTARSGPLGSAVRRHLVKEDVESKADLGYSSPRFANVADKAAKACLMYSSIASAGY
jgi:hypothetical protein